MGTKIKSPAGHFNHLPLTVKKDPQTWGRKRFGFFLDSVNHYFSEKRIPKHGDENSFGSSPYSYSKTSCEKRIPKHGDEN